MESKNNNTMDVQPDEELEQEEKTTMILEINLISAQNLKNIKGRGHRNTMHTYAVAWVDPHHKLRSDLDRIGGVNPTWNDKFIFRVSQPFIDGDTSAVQFHIYAVGYIRDYFIGTVRYLLSSSSNPPIRSSSVTGIPSFSALHIRRPSGRVHGVLNIAATVYNSSDFPSLMDVDAICFRDLIRLNNKKNKNRRLKTYLGRHHLGLKTSSYKSYESSETGTDQDSCGEDSDGTEADSTESCNAFRDTNIVMAGNQSNGRTSLLCGLLMMMMSRTRRSSPSLRNLFKLEN